MVSAMYPWFLRSGRHDNEAITGVFTFNNWYGSGDYDVSFRQSRIKSKNKIICKVYL